RMKDENSGGTAPDSFQTKPAYARAIILVAGIVFNFLFAALIFAFIFATYGAPTNEVTVRVGSVVSGTPAEQAGWRSVEVFVSVDGQTITSQDDLKRAIDGASGRPIQAQLRRDGQIITTTITPRRPEAIPEGQGATGISVDSQYAVKRQPVWEAVPN